MCGIAGCIGVTPPRTSAFLQQMKQALSPRGPDDHGIWNGERVHFVHTRLSIIDLEGSRQPMFNEDRSLSVTFNGEIYNYKHLRAELRGHHFASSGDTEVLLHAYKERGPAMVEDLDGMFAFALYNRAAHTLMLARDRIGIKPLYYWHDDSTGELAFASNLRALLANGTIRRTLSRSALAEYLHFGYVVHPNSWIQGVQQLEPGHTLLWQDGRIRKHRYYAWQYRPNHKLESTSKAHMPLRDKLLNCVSSHLMADVPIGTFLSGGLDSTTVTGLAQEARSQQEGPVNSFTARFWLPEYDESPRARSIASELGTNHAEIQASALPFSRETLEEIVDGLGEPFADTSALAVYELCRRARQHVKVALAGDGGDEIFLGYTGLFKQRLARRLRQTPATMRRMGLHLVGRGRSDFFRRVRKYTALSLQDDAGLIIDWARRWEWSELDAVLGHDMVSILFPEPEQLFPHVRNLIGAGETGGFLEQQIRFHLLVDLPADCLFKVDRMSMAHGLEVRVPMLANEMLNYASELPLAARVRGKRTKEPLRTLAESLAPTVAKPSPKRGFSFPLDAWTRQQLSSYWKEWGMTDVLATLGFSKKGTNELLASHQALESSGESFESRSLSRKLFDLLLLGVWVQKYSVTA